MKFIPGFSMVEDDRYFSLIDSDGLIDTDDLEERGLKWEWNNGADGPVLAGKAWRATISKPGRGGPEEK